MKDRPKTFVPKTVIHLETVEREDGNAISHFQGSINSLVALIYGTMIAEKIAAKVVLDAAKLYIELTHSGTPSEEFAEKTEELTEEEFNAS